MLRKLLQKITNRFNREPLTDGQRRKKLHDSGNCPKALGGYTCKGGIRNGVAYGECE